MNRILNALRNLAAWAFAPAEHKCKDCTPLEACDKCAWWQAIR